MSKKCSLQGIDVVTFAIDIFQCLIMSVLFEMFEVIQNRNQVFAIGFYIRFTSLILSNFKVYAACYLWKVDCLYKGLLSYNVFYIKHKHSKVNMQ